MNSKPFTEEEFKSIYSRVPRLCVDLIVQTPTGIALALRKLPSWNGQWHFPGGTVLYKESLQDTANRVALDEIGIPVHMEKLLGYIEYDEELHRGFGHTVSLAFLCLTDRTDMRPNEDASEIKIFQHIPQNIIREQGQFLESSGLMPTSQVS